MIYFDLNMFIVADLTMKSSKKLPSEIFWFWNTDFLVLAHFGSEVPTK